MNMKDKDINKTKSDISAKKYLIKKQLKAGHKVLDCHNFLAGILIVSIADL